MKQEVLQITYFPFFSIFYLLDNCEPRVNQFPLLEARLELKEPNLIISPSPEELLALAESLVNDILHISTLVPRLSTHAHATYLVSITHSIHLYTCQIYEITQLINTKCKIQMQKFMYPYLSVFNNVATRWLLFFLILKFCLFDYYHGYFDEKSIGE